MLSGARLAAIRVAAGLTQSDLAQRIGTHQSRVAEWESCRSQPHARFMERLVVVLNVTAGDLTTGGADHPTLGDLRKAAGLTVDDVVEATGISVRLYRSLETGKRVNEPPAQAVLRLAALLKVHPSKITAAINAARAESL